MAAFSSLKHRGIESTLETKYDEQEFVRPVIKGRIGMKKARDRQSKRREFLLQSASTMGALALSPTSVVAGPRSANDCLGVAIAGCGSRGGTLLSWALRLASTLNIEVRAVCDLLEERRTRAAQRVEAQTGRRPVACRNLAEVCDRGDIDCVLIATPDFQHCVQAAQVAEAGKDVYVEKPFGCDWDQVRSATGRIARTGRLLQIGIQSLGSQRLSAAARFVQTGRLGQITYVEIAEPLFQQRWRIPGSERGVSREQIDWGEFLTYLPSDTPFSARHYLEFRLFWPFSSGPFCQWMSSRIAVVNQVLGRLPSAAVALGGVYLWKDGRTNPDTVQCLLEYPGGTLVSYSLRLGNSHGGRGTTFYGTAGTLELETGIAFGNGGGGLVVEGEVRDGIRSFRVDPSRLLRAKKEGGIEFDAGEPIDYLSLFFQGIRQRRILAGGLDVAYGQSVATILANQAYRCGVRMTYDPAGQAMVPSPAASMSQA